MKQFKILTYCLLTVIGLISSTSCVDDELYNPDDLGDGMAKVTANFTFDCYTDALTDSRSAGESLDQIKSLQIAVYDLEGNLVRSEYRTGITTKVVSAPKYEYNSETGENVQVGEESTRQATLQFDNKLAYGRYYIYAIANVGHNIPSDSIATRDDLRRYPIVWYPTKLANNGQMLGTFSEEPQASYNNETTVAISRPEQIIHAWVRRAASKVTVAYDASGLDDNVFIYIHSVRIHDIPRRSTLGSINTADSEEPFKSVTSKEDLIATGEILYYDKQGNITTKSSNWGSATTEGKDDPSINKDELLKGDRENIRNASQNWLKLANGKSQGGTTNHLHSDQALFFYENLQGNYPDQPLYDKRQYAKEEGSGIVKDKDWSRDDVSEGSDWKDRVPYGTWIEVRGYYENKDKTKISSGPIIYRFMLGKDTKFDYNCERNHHYKLTLKFNGQANNIDWHIDYKEESPSIILPTGFHVSYLYGQKAILPVKVRVPEDAENIVIRTDIVENNWRPDNYNDSEWPSHAKCQEMYETLRQGTNKTPRVKTKLDDNVTGSVICKKYNAFGFISLRNVAATAEITEDKNIDDIDRVTSWFNDGQCGWNQYDVNGKLPEAGKSESYTSNGETFICSGIKDEFGTAYLYQLPVYTQPRVMGGWAVFSGSNPFEWSERSAIVRVTLTFNTKGSSVPQKLTSDVTIHQDPKIINPVGIWRRSSNTRPFNVVLQYRKTAAGDFTPLESDGPWKAYVVSGDKDLVKLSKLGNSQKYGDTIRGKSGSLIEFKYTPVGVSSKKPRFAVIKIEYHNYTSNHIIYVRQGYQDVTIDNTTWSTFNLYKNGVRCASPLAPGSFYRRGNHEQAITEKTSVEYGYGVKPLAFWINGTADTDKISSWSDISQPGNGVWSTGDDTYEIPTAGEAAALVNDLTARFGYGVVYADGASEVATSHTEAFGFSDPENKITASTKGMRGVIYAHNSGDNYAQVFFPLGSEGHGKRSKGRYHATLKYLNTSDGELRYSGVSQLLPLSTDNAPGDNADHNNWYRPLALDTFDQPGALYWLSSGADQTYALDINFRVWRFNYYPRGELYIGSKWDACLIKPTVVK